MFVACGRLCSRRREGEETMADAIRITKTASGKKKPKDKDLAFGNVFTDHMFVADFQEEKGWYDPRVEPYAPFALDPATAVLHYGQSLFEGLKAFRGRDGTIRLFRPQKHVERLNRTAARMTIPQLDPELILHSWTTLVDVDRDWAPSSVGTSLYIRPTIIASEAFLGVRPAKEYLYYVIVSPVGPYYPEGLAPTKIKVIENYVRAVAGGLGEAKTSANYAASLYAAEEAKHEGFTQVLWLDGVQHKYIEEVGTSNIMLRIGDEVVAAAENGTLREVWATGTAAVISPVGELAYKGRRLVVNQGRIGELAQKLYDTIVAIQYGE